MRFLQTVKVTILCVLGLSMLLGSNVYAAPKEAAPVVKELTPDEVIQKITDDMMAAIKNGEQALKENPEQYFQTLENILEKTVHFPYISKFVMGDYWDGASSEQRKTFSERFKRSMVETIGKGLANYSDLKLNIIPAKAPPKKNVAIVTQEVQGAKTPITISYWMARNKQREWKLIDVVLDGVKLRETFRSQFKADMGKNKNDYDKVIEAWNKVDVKA